METSAGVPAGGSVEKLVIATFALLGLAIGARPISDNSSFLHLRTGIQIVSSGHVPHVDIYSFSAHGHPWIVQSWLASVAYGLAYRLGRVTFGPTHGANVVVLLQAGLMATLGVSVASLARTGSGVRTMASAGVAVTLSALYWSPRPLIFGLLALALVITIVERDLNPLYLIPVWWVWVNTHGSFPLGVAWLVLRFAGEGIDRRTVRRLPWRFGVMSVAGVAISMVNPIGPKLLSFPFTIGDKQAAFKHIVEWASPNFQTGQGMLTLLVLGLAVLILCRCRLRWTETLPVVAFMVLGLFAARNLSVLGVVLAPALGQALRSPGSTPEWVASDTGGRRRRRLDRVAAAALVLIAVLFVSASFEGNGLRLTLYPTKAESWMAANGWLDPGRHRVVSQDWVGCYLILVRGTAGRVFIDDRVDMYPLAVSADYESLLHGQANAGAILDRYRADAVLWQRRLGLVSVLEHEGGWTRSYEDRDWVVLTRS